ncbi:hypothetical protein [Polaribacter sp. Hel1_85]|uniref:hypothetical protein n=1 Tax=Polaribacter sp. Hel1_85 TaxID=1250005 RepID=UPI00052D4F19|nr:hypothetical protein [Polaribacter sp. Hel1_85]KGL64157.1 hypothetical protein PHEL85_1209 [Polaribacter sp. Hel1_85]
MEENKHIEELHTFAKKYVKEIPQEKPSLDFTAFIMQSILEESTSKSSVFTPKALITKKGWFLIIGLLLVAIFVPFKQMKENTIQLPKLDFSFFDKIQIPNLFESFSVSNTVLYAMFFFGLMIIAQVVFLKGYFEKRI